MKPTTNNQQPTTLFDLYASREQELLAYLREAQTAAAVGNVDGVLRMQAKVYAVLVDIIGDQTQQVLRFLHHK